MGSGGRVKQYGWELWPHPPHSCTSLSFHCSLDCALELRMRPHPDHSPCSVRPPCLQSTIMVPWRKQVYSVRASVWMKCSLKAPSMKWLLFTCIESFIESLWCSEASPKKLNLTSSKSLGRKLDPPSSLGSNSQIQPFVIARVYAHVRMCVRVCVHGEHGKQCHTSSYNLSRQGTPLSSPPPVSHLNLAQNPQAANLLMPSDSYVLHRNVFYPARPLLPIIVL